MWDNRNVRSTVYLIFIPQQKFNSLMFFFSDINYKLCHTKIALHSLIFININTTDVCKTHNNSYMFISLNFKTYSSVSWLSALVQYQNYNYGSYE